MTRYKHAALALGMLLMGGYLFYRFGEQIARQEYGTAFLYSALGFCAVGAATEPGFLLRNVSALVTTRWPASRFTVAVYGLALVSAVLWAVL